MTVRKTWRRAGTIVAATLLLAACSQTVSGHGAVAKDAGTPLPQPSGGDTGPQASFGESVTIIESRRLAYATPRPDTLDKGYVKSCLPTLPLKSVEALGGFGGLFVDKTVAVFRKGGFVAGYVQCRQDPTGRATVAAAIEMRDESSARKAAGDIVPTIATNGAKAAPLSGVDSATAVSGFDDNLKRHVVQTVVAYNRLVLYQYSDDKDNTRLLKTVVATMQAALARAKLYEATPLDQMNALQDDPRHLKRLLASPKGTTYVTGGGYDLDGYYGIAEDPEAERTLLSANGFSAYYGNQGDHEGYGVYDLSGPKSAAAVVAGFVKIDQREHRGLFGIPVKGLPKGAACFGFLQENHPVQRCFFTAKRYVYQVDAYGFPNKDLRNGKYIGAAVAKQMAKVPR